MALLGQVNEQQQPQDVKLLFITYFPMPTTIFPSAFTSAHLLKSNYRLVNLRDIKNKGSLARGAVTGNVKADPAQEPWAAACYRAEEI